jgi:hypothetical protein
MWDRQKKLIKNVGGLQNNGKKHLYQMNMVQNKVFPPKVSLTTHMCEIKKWYVTHRRFKNNITMSIFPNLLLLPHLENTMGIFHIMVLICHNFGQSIKT